MSHYKIQSRCQNCLGKNAIVWFRLLPTANGNVHKDMMKHHSNLFGEAQPRDGLQNSIGPHPQVLYGHVLAPAQRIYDLLRRLLCLLDEFLAGVFIYPHRKAV